MKIDENTVELKCAPYVENGVCYVPYEYIKKLGEYEKIHRKQSREIGDSTSRFTSVMKYGYDSFENEYRCDSVEIDRFPAEILPNDTKFTSLSSFECLDTEAVVKGSGFRTNFKLKMQYSDLNTENVGDAELVLNKVTRIYSKGSDIEGLFTLKIDGKTIYENEVGYINSLPHPSGEGIPNNGTTDVEVGDVRFRIFFEGYSCERAERYGEQMMSNREKDKLPETKVISMLPKEVLLDGYFVTRTTKNCSFTYNAGESYGMLNLIFSDYSEENYENSSDYSITLDEVGSLRVIDESTFSGHFFFTKGGTRIDSFDANIILFSDGKFAFVSNDGRYVVRGNTEDYVPS